jgi:hypothetical protein
VSYVVRAATAAAGLLAVAGLLAGCGGKSSPSGAGAASSAPAGAGFQAYTDCLRQHGVTINLPSDRPTVRPSGFRPSGVRPSGLRPSRFRGGGGGGFPGVFGTAAPPGVDQATWDAAQQACASLRPSFGPRAGGGAAAAYRNCLRDHGVTGPAGPNQMNTANPKVAAAMQACAPLRPTGGPGAPSPAPTPTG